MAKASPRIIFFYLLIPAICIIFVYSFIFAKFSPLNQPHVNLQQQLIPDVDESYQTYSIPYSAMRATTPSVPGDASYIEDKSIKSMPVLDTVEDYLLLNHTPKNTSFWSSTLDNRYRNEKNKFNLKVIIIPHSHNDPGWLSTYDHYYYQYTFNILGNLVKNLNKYPNMTFIWPEMSYFSRWWDSVHSESHKRNLKKLLKEGRFEIVTGGWVMSDEGPAHYFDMLDQLIEGHQFLRTELGYHSPPKNSWSIDPFGHSSTFPYLLQNSGVTKVYIQRTHFAWKRHLSNKRFLEFFWNQYFQSAQSLFYKPLMCHMSPLDLYSYKYACGPDPKTCLEFDFRKIFGESSESTAVPLNETNIDTKARKIVDQYEKLGSLFSHNVALVLLGDDFRYSLDIEWQQQYKNYDYLMNYINANKDKFNNAEVKFGTLQDYFEEVERRIPIKSNNYPSLYGDFMPYADVYVNSVPNYWTGYYTTRPYFKSLSRELQHWLRSTEILYSLTRNFLNKNENYTYLTNVLLKDYGLISTARQNLALFQHHDGITGTSREYVMEDYGRRLSHSIANMMDVLARSVQYLNLNNAYSSNNSELFISATSYRPNWDQNTQKHILKIPADSNGLKLMVFNSHLQKRTESITVLVEDPFIKIIDVEANIKLNFQVNPIYNNSTISSSVFQIEFVDTFYPLSLKNYKILTNEDNIAPKVKIIKLSESVSSDSTTSEDRNEAFILEQSQNLILSNAYLNVHLSRKGFIESIHYKKSNVTIPIEMSFMAYNSEPTESGAYLFKPKKHDSLQNMFNSVDPRLNLFGGTISSTLIVNYTDISFSIKLYNSSSEIGMGIELKVNVNLENKEAYNDKEIVIRFKTPIINRNLKSDQQEHRTFYVDSNGFQMMERNFVESTGIEGNYYPMTTAIFIEDDRNRFTVLSSFSHGATSPLDGSIEIMLDRRILQDDKRGLSQGVTDNLPFEASFWLLFEQKISNQPSDTDKINSLSEVADSLLLLLNYPSVVTYSYRSDKEIYPLEMVPYYRNRYLIAPGLMCRYFLLNLRSLPLSNRFSYPSNSSLLILQNRVFSSKILAHDAGSEFATECMPDISLPKQNNRLFNDLKIASVQHCSLSGMEIIKRLTSISDIIVPAYEIYSYNITFV